MDKNGRALIIIMPSEVFHAMSDDDVHAIVVHLRSQPAVERATPPRSITALGAAIIGAGLFPTAVQPPVTQPVVAPPVGVSPAYGLYLVSISGCQVCHGSDLAGRQPTGRGPPAGPNLMTIEADFLKTIRTSVDPTGHSLRRELMPCKLLSAA